MVCALDIETRPAWLILFADRLRPDYARAIGWLRDLGIEAQILSGDRGQSVVETACATGLFARAGMSPEGKQQAIAMLRNMGTVC
jgi:Cu2+-exporting ATPase